MDEPPGARLRVALCAFTMAEYFRDMQQQDVLLFISDIFRFVQTGPEVIDTAGPDAERSRLPAERCRRRSASCRSLSPPPRRYRLNRAAGDLRPRGRHTRTRPPTPPSATRCHHGVVPASLRAWNLSGGRPARLDQPNPRPALLGEDHYAFAGPVQEILQRNKDLQDIIAILGIDDCPKRTWTLCRGPAIQRFLSQPFFVAEHSPASRAPTCRSKRRSDSFKGAGRRRVDHLPEQAFFLVGGIEEAEAKAKEMEAA